MLAEFASYRFMINHALTYPIQSGFMRYSPLRSDARSGNLSHKSWWPLQRPRIPGAFFRKRHPSARPRSPEWRVTVSGSRNRTGSYHMLSYHKTGRAIVPALTCLRSRMQGTSFRRMLLCAAPYCGVSFGCEDIPVYTGQTHNRHSKIITSWGRPRIHGADTKFPKKISATNDQLLPPHSSMTESVCVIFLECIFLRMLPQYRILDFLRINQGDHH